MKRWMSMVCVTLCGLFLTVGQAQAGSTKKKEKQGEEFRGKGGAPIGHIKKHRSIFSDDNQQGETEAEYRARVKKMRAAELAKQRKRHERKKMKAKGKALDKVKPVDDEDPLSGI